MKSFFVASVLFFSVSCLLAQTPEAPPPVVEQIEEAPQPTMKVEHPPSVDLPVAPESEPPAEERVSEIFDIEEPPQFPGGEAALYKYIAENLQYPPEARKKAIQGLVVCTFVIARDGSVEKAKIIRDIGQGCGEEALRIINAMPKWTPGVANGRPVKVRYTLPLRFKLE